MTWKGIHPGVALVTTTEAMDLVEAQIKRLPLLEKWFVDIGPAPPSLWAS
jgi:hypothetical protein